MKKDWPRIRPGTNHEKKGWWVDARFTNASGERKGERKFLDTKKEAEGWADGARVIKDKEGMGAFHNDELQAFGWTVADAIRFALEYLRKRGGSVQIEEAIKKLVETKRGAGCSKDYCDNVALRLNRLAAILPGKSVGEITTAELDAFLRGLNAAPGNFNTFRRDIRTLWSFCEKNKWAESDVAKGTERMRSKDTAPLILTPEETAALLAQSDGELLAYHAIGVFAGLRPCEIRRIQWGRHVNFAKGFIELDGSITKTGQRRLVPILPNLRAWLEPIAQPFGAKVITNPLRNSCWDVQERAGIKWSANVMRHSFASYRLADVQSAPQVALETGHSVTVLYKHYRELVMPEDAKRYFAIVPSESAAEKIVSMVA